MKSLGQFFTPSHIAQLCCKNLQYHCGEILELGSGGGSLAHAALSAMSKGRYTGVEVDENLYKTLVKAFSGENIIWGDALDEGVIEKTIIDAGYDAVVGNPPFMSVRPNSSRVRQMLKDCFPGCHSSSALSRAEMYFLGISFSLLKEGGKLSMILPKNLFSSSQYTGFRQDLLNACQEVSFIELPSNVFSGAEVNTCIIQLTKGIPNNQPILLNQLSAEGQLRKPIHISRENAVTRIDYTYYDLAMQHKLDNCTTIKDLGVDVRRGIHSKSEYEKQGTSYFHTTHFPENENYVTFETDCEGNVSAREGDIVLPRVGTRCLDRQAIVSKGSSIITDCVYRLRGEEVHIELLMSALSSPLGKRWRKMQMRGSCAQFISREGILSFPVA